MLRKSGRKNQYLKVLFRMYSLARDWVKTKYYRPPPSALQKSSLPPPSQKWNNLDSNGRYHSPLVPPLYPFEKGNPNLTNKKDILNEHMIRWKRVAQDWKNQSKGRITTSLVKKSNKVEKI